MPAMLGLALSGRIARVTGASGEPGRVMAGALAGRDADVAIQYFKNREAPGR